MKLGNVSQSIIPVPKFFLNKRSLDLFTSNTSNTDTIPSDRNLKKSKIKDKNKKKFRNKSYYRVKDILSLNCDLNINLNPRSFSRQSTTDNTEKYIPLYHRKAYQNNVEIKQTYFPDIIDMNPIKSNAMASKTSSFQKYKQYRKKINIEGLVNPDLRKDIMYDTQNLLDRLNMNYDIKKWNDFDCRTTMNRFHQTAYSPLTDVIQNNISDKEAFSSTLRDKALTLKTISSKAKESIQRAIIQKDLEENMKNGEEKINNENTDILLKNNRNNFLRLRYNNCDAPQYNEVDKQFIADKKLITDKKNITLLYKEFPSSIKEEFNDINVYKKKEPLKMTNYKGYITKEKYGYKNFDSNGDELTSCQDPMWIRPLHKDAYK